MSGINARFQNGLVLQGGVSSGKQVEDNCEVVAKLPEMNSITAADAGSANSGQTGGAPAQLRPAGFCHREQPWLTGAKALAIYIIPKADVQVSGSFRSTPGTALTAGFTATNAYLAANSTLGRPLSGGAANVVIGIEEINTDVYRTASRARHADRQSAAFREGTNGRQHGHLQRVELRRDDQSATRPTPRGWRRPRFSMPVC